MPAITGTVTYRCADCGQLIEGEAVLSPLGDDGGLLPTTRSYHPEHAPEVQSK